MSAIVIMGFPSTAKPFGSRELTKRRILVWTLRGCAGLFLVFGLAAGAGYIWLRGSLPQTDGTLKIAALEAPVTVLRDRDGMVTIRARNEPDAALALGFVHAQDRLWQMEFMRRSGAGRLSEVLGPTTRRLDRFLRTLGFYRLAEANLRTLSAPTRALVEAYTAGVNAFISDPGGPLPLEFLLLGTRPEPWRPADSLVWGRLMALQLSGNWSDEILRSRLARRLAPEQIAFLWPGYPADAPIALGDLVLDLETLPLAALAAVLPWELAPKDASNSWVLAGPLTASGAPILANDPHLALTAPGPWYLARIDTPTLTLVGATAPGVPFLIAGHNGAIAWGFTTTHSDTQDLFIERVAEGDPDRYLTPDGDRAFETRVETIEVRDGKAWDVTLRATRHGPVISDAVTGAADVTESGTVLSLAWPALRADDRTIEALYGINHARDWVAFRAALEDFHSPHQNIVYADTQGTIGFAAPARVPIRKRGDGRAPVAGWTGAYDWNGLIPFEALPMAVNPRVNRIVAANNKIVPDDYPYLLTADWPAAYRAMRIHRLLDGADKPPRTPEESLAMQQDIVSLAARALLPHLLTTAPTSDRGREALALLAQWDGDMDRTRPEPLIFYSWMRALTRSLLADELGDVFDDFLRPRADLLVRILSEGKTWCDDVRSDAREDCPMRLAESLEAALTGLSRHFPGPLGQLRWGDAHRARFPHPVLSQIPILRRLFAIQVETDGGSYTLNRAGVGFHGPEERLFEDIHGAGYRAVYDLADLDESHFMIATGQSGNPLSPLYGTLAARWRDGEYVKLSGQAGSPAGLLKLLPD